MNSASRATTMPTLADFYPDVFLEEAARATGLDDYGDLAFLEGLDVFLQDLREEAGLNAQGVMAQYHDLLRLLSNRLGFQRDLKAHPEILDETIERPIIIMGLPRSGTTKLQRMLSADPGVQRLEMWRMQFPAPLPGSGGMVPDPRIALAEQIEAVLRNHFPEVMARHPMEAREPDEELWLLEMTFETWMASLKTRAPNHRRWLRDRPQQKPYGYMKSLLQYLQWQDGGGRGRPWIMKSVIHIGELPTVLETFPDATIVHCHRDPQAIIGSFTSLIEFSRLTQCDSVNLAELGDDFNRFWAGEMNRNLDARAALGKDRILDFQYEDIRDNPGKVIGEIHAKAGRDISPSAEEAFRAYADARPIGHFGTYQYSLEHYGLSAQKVETAFARYLEAFPGITRS